MSIYHLELPETEEWKKLVEKRKNDKLKGIQVYPEEELNVGKLKVIYKLSEDSKCASLYDLYDDDMEFYGTGITVPFSSVYKGYDMAPEGTPFRNMIGTSRYRPSCKSWIYAHYVITRSHAKCCCSDGYTYFDDGCKNPIQNEKICNDKYCECKKFTHNLVGAHVVVGKSTDGSTYRGIVPLCDRHNKQYRAWMKFGAETYVMLLRDQINHNVYQPYIDKMEGENNE